MGKRHYWRVAHEDWRKEYGPGPNGGTVPLGYKVTTVYGALRSRRERVEDDLKWSLLFFADSRIQEVAVDFSDDEIWKDGLEAAHRVGAHADAKGNVPCPWPDFSLESGVWWDGFGVGTEDLIGVVYGNDEEDAKAGD